MTAGKAPEGRKNEYFDPLFYISNEKYPFVMIAYLTLFEDVDGALLAEVAESLRDRFPYFYIRVKAQDEELRAVPNPLPVPVRNSWEPTTIGSKENNYHLIAFRHEGKRLGVEISHCITDGAGFMPFLRAILYLYLSKKEGKQFNPAGIRLPGTDFVPGELGNPWPQDLLAINEGPLSVHTPIDFYQLTEGPVPMDGERRLFFLKLSAIDLMDFCRQNDGSPNAAVSVMWARAIRKVDPQMSKGVSICVCVNKKGLLGNYENYHYGVDAAFLDFPADHPIDDLTKACTIARGQIINQTLPDNLVHSVKQTQQDFVQIDAIPTLEMKLGALGETLAPPRATAMVSYTGNRTMGDLDPYIDEFYCVAETIGVGILTEINCLNHSFYLSITQNFTSDAYVQAFLEELREAGVAYEVMGEEPFFVSSARFEDLGR